MRELRHSRSSPRHLVARCDGLCKHDPCIITLVVFAILVQAHAQLLPGLWEEKGGWRENNCANGESLSKERSFRASRSRRLHPALVSCRAVLLLFHQQQLRRCH